MDRVKNGVSPLVRRVVRRSPPLIYAWLRFLYKVWRNFDHCGGVRCCSSLSFTLLLAFIPFAVSMASLSNWLPFSPTIISDVERFFFNQYIPQAGDEIYRIFLLSFRHSKRLSYLGLFSLLVSCYGMMFALEQHINLMWHIRRGRRFYHSLLIYSAFFGLSPLVVYSLAYLINIIDAHVVDIRLVHLVGYLASHLITFLSFVAIYRFIPNNKVQWQHALVAGIMAGIAFMLMQVGFNLSMDHLQLEYGLLYGSLAMLPIFMLWLYLSVLILLLGAQTIYVFEFLNKRRQYTRKI